MHPLAWVSTAVLGKLPPQSGQATGFEAEGSGLTSFVTFRRLRITKASIAGFSGGRRILRVAQVLAGNHLSPGLSLLHMSYISLTSSNQWQSKIH
eukprot:scaffold602_cov298-Pinguiococcus_pyrenoidosus.AAC.27